MNPSPLRSLISRRVCSCSATQLPSRTLVQFCINPRTFSRPSPRHASQYANAPTTYGASDNLRRRYQPPAASVKLTKEERAQTMKRIRYSAVGVVLCALGIFGTVYTYPDPRKEAKKSIPSKVTSLDAPPSIAGVSSGTSVSEDVEQVPTGTSTIPTFPKYIHLSSLDPPSSDLVVDTGEQEYQLVGLGIRTVSFLGIQVYVVGLYIAIPDIAILQERLVKTVEPGASALVAGEKGKLKELLLDAEKGEEVWDSLLKDGGIRTAIRIVPTRNTDFMHLRDGWVRGITARTQHFGAKGDKTFDDESFARSVNEFKAIWGGGARKNVPKGETLLLTRDAHGKLAAWYEDKKGSSLKLGGMADERISRLIWLGYLGGKTVSSESARQSIVDGVMEYVERPVGTVATQVV